MEKRKILDTLLSIVVEDSDKKIDYDKDLGNIYFVKELLKLANRNGLLYPTLYKINQIDANNTFVTNLLQKETAKFNQFKKTVSLLTETSDTTGIPYILIKACTELDHVPRDIDIFVKSEDRIRLIDALSKYGINCVHSDSIDTTLKSNSYTKIDIYTRLRYFTIDFIDEKFLWNSVAYDKFFGIDYYGLDKEANFLIIIIHSLFGHSSMSLLDFLHMKSLISGISDIEYCRDYAYDSRWGIAFDMFLNEFKRIDREIILKNNKLKFPYFFNSRFFFECVYNIEDFNLTNKNKFFLAASLVQDRLLFELKDGALYNIMKNFEPTRKFVNSTGYFIRSMRGDHRSGEK